MFVDWMKVIALTASVGQKEIRWDLLIFPIGQLIRPRKRQQLKCKTLSLSAIGR